MPKMRLLGNDIEYREDYIAIDKLKYFVDNPRVYSVVHGIPGFKASPDEEQQEKIEQKLWQEPSVKNLLPEIKRHQGLIEPILVRHDTMQVIEGNSRLAAYRKLYTSDSEGDWGLVPCKIVTRLDDKELFAFLSEIHLKGKTRWTKYEKYNFAYVQLQKGLSPKKIAALFGESEPTIRHRIKVIELMEQKDDNTRLNLSYYEVVVRDNNAYQKMRDGGLNRIMEEIKSGSDTSGTPDDDDDEGNSKPFTAQELRKALPDLLKKPRVLKQYEEGKIGFTEASERARVSEVRRKIQTATVHLSDVSRIEINELESNDLNALRQAFRKLSKEVNRVKKLIEKEKP